MSPRYLEAYDRHMGEFYALLLFAIVGMDLMAASRDLIAFYVGLELMAVAATCSPASSATSSSSNEAALKYFLTGAFASAFTLYGVSLVYGLTGATNYAAEVGPGALWHRQHDLAVAFATALVVVGTGLQGVDGALPHVDARRLRGRAHAGGRLLLGRPQSRGLLRPS